MGNLCTNTNTTNGFPPSALDKQKNMQSFTTLNHNQASHGPKPSEGKFLQQGQFILPKQIVQLAQKKLKTSKVSIKGEEILPPFQFFNSEWKNGKPEGYGKLFDKNKQNYYEGFFKDGKPQGFGRFINKNGTQYEGSIKDGKANGEGQYRFDQTEILGTFKNNLPQGKCIQKTKDYIYQGQFSNGKWSGQSKLLYGEQKYQYIGTFAQGLFNGKGTLKTPFYKYRGIFQNGVKNGQGVLQLKNGQVYKGKFKNDVPNGKGQLFIDDKLIYLGEFTNGKANGIGKYKINDVFAKSQWSNGQFVSTK